MMRRLLLPLLAGAIGCAGPQLSPSPELLSGGPPPGGISAEAWTHAVAAHRLALTEGVTSSPLLTVIDFSLPSSAQRLWVVNTETREVLTREYVAHGAQSGGTFPTRFSNRSGTRQSSLGTFVTASTFRGIRGLSLRLRGLEPGINDHAWQRGIVIHGTPNVSEARARNGTQGRTEGCPAVPAASARRLIRLIENGVVVFAWYPDKGFLAHSEYLDRGYARLRLSASD